MTNILKTTNAARAATLASERTAALSLHRLHYQAVVQVKDGVARFIHTMQAATSDNNNVIPHSYASAAAAQPIARPIAVAMQQFGNSARVVISNEQSYAAQRGTIMAQQQLQATVPRGYTWHFTQPAPSMQAQAQRVYTLFDKYGDEAATAATDAIRTGVLAGHGPAVIARDIQDALGGSLSNALMISRTEAMRSLRDATLENYRANSDVVDAWVWLASDGCCVMCAAMQGEEFDTDVSMDSHPGCRCACVPKTKSWSDILGSVGIDGSDIPETQVDVPDGSEWFASQDESYQREALGASGYNAWKAGAFQLSDLVGTAHNAVWGASRYQKSLKDLGIDASDYSDE